MIQQQASRAERRTCSRHALDMDVEILQFGVRRMFHGHATDVSRSGVYLETEEVQPPVGRPVFLSLRIPGRPGREYLASATVVRRTDRGLGLEFLDDDPDTRQCIQALLQAVDDEVAIGS